MEPSIKRIIVSLSHHRASFFVQFVCDQARISNYPSFSVSMQSHLKQENFSRLSNKIPVSVRKTEVLATVSNSKAKQLPEQKILDPSKQCPIHNKPHPLSKCRGFRVKPLDEEKHTSKIYLSASGVAVPINTWQKSVGQLLNVESVTVIAMSLQCTQGLLHGQRELQWQSKSKAGSPKETYHPKLPPSAQKFVVKLLDLNRARKCVWLTFFHLIVLNKLREYM